MRLLPSLIECPLDIDGLRLYVILTEFEMFRVGERYKTLAVPLAKKLLQLRENCKVVVGLYFVAMSVCQH